MRVSGAQWLGGIGLGVHMIRSLARWDSDIVMRYLRDSHLVNLTDDAIRLLSNKAVASEEFQQTRQDYLAKQLDDQDGGHSVSGLAAEIEELKGIVAQVTAEAERRDARFVAINDAVEQLETEPAGVQAETRVSRVEDAEYVINRTTQVIHRIADGGTHLPPNLWAARCRWRFGAASDAELSNDLFANGVRVGCKRCGLKGLRGE